jgi:hypothetical protein
VRRRAQHRTAILDRHATSQHAAQHRQKKYLKTTVSKATKASCKRLVNLMLGLQSIKTPATMNSFKGIRMFKTRQFRIWVGGAAGGGAEDDERVRYPRLAKGKA